MPRAFNYAKYPTDVICVGRSIYSRYILRHIAHLWAAKNPAYHAIIAETIALYNEIFGFKLDYIKQLYERISLTREVKELKKEFNKLIDGHEAIIVFKYEKHSEVCSEVFPPGISPFKKSMLRNLKIMMDLADKYASI